MFKKLLNKIPPVFKNKYLLTGVVFLILIVFIDRNNLISQFKLRRQLNNLKKQEQFYREETRRDSIEYQKLVSDTAEMERVGREKYFMKRDSEDIYIINRVVPKEK